jgi:hypothetical protein
MKIYIKYVIILLVVLLMSGMNIKSDDKELFMGVSLGDTNTVRPNVVILMDSSGSMNTIIFYPKNGLDGEPHTADDGYDSTVSYSGSVDSAPTSLTTSGWYGRWIIDGRARLKSDSDLSNINGGSHWTGCYAGDGSGTNFQVGTNAIYFQAGEIIMFRDTSAPYNSARCKLINKTVKDGNNWFELEILDGGPITVNGGHFQRSPYGDDWKPVVIQLYGISDSGQAVRYPDNYLKWMFIHANEDQQKAISHFSTWGTFDVNNEPPEELSNCATPGNDDLSKSGARIKKTFTRIQTAREVVCKVASNSNKIVKLGLFDFNYDNGSSLVEGLTDMSDESSLLVAYKNNVWGIAGTSWTPLAESLADIWYYIKPGPSSKTRWPVDYEIQYDLVSHSVTNPVTPVDYWCQNNYVVIMTDGESSKDRFDDWGKYGNSIFRKKPVKRKEPWNSWNDGWGDPDNYDQNNGLPSYYNPSGTYCPNYTCWLTGSGGSDYLDDVAYFLNHQDMFPDDHFGTDANDGWPGQQNIFTYTIGFNADNDMLLQTAINGDGAYYTATNYEELVDAFQLVITSINLRNYAFSAITAPKKTATATDEELTMSYVGYFLPSQAAPIWEGHLLAFRLNDAWGFDADGNGEVGPEEYVYETQEECLNARGSDQLDQDCSRWVSIPIGHEWDAADKVPATEQRQLFTYDLTNNTLLEFTDANKETLRPSFGSDITSEESSNIIAKIRNKQFGDVFHSDVGFVGPPPLGKQFVTNINPPGENDETFAHYAGSQANRRRMLYTGTNDGILHMLYADGVGAGTEVWGFIPDEVLPSLTSIALDNIHTYTVDGRLTATDIYYEKSGTLMEWSTVLLFGLRGGGDAYYTLDITNIGTQPSVLWKFKDATHSGNSWGKPVVGKIKLLKDGNVEEKWAAILTGGFEFNHENPNDPRGKAIFVVDAVTGELIWMLGYDRNGPSDPIGAPDILECSASGSDNRRYLTASDDFNFCIPSSLTSIDEDGDGFMDAIFFGNLGGMLFKTDITDYNIENWVTTKIYKTSIGTKDSAVIGAVTDNIITLKTKAFQIGDNIMGTTSFAYGHILDIDNRDITVLVDKGTFQAEEILVSRKYDPIFMSPSVFYDNCYQMWVIFGTGDRDRPRTNYEQGRFVALRDNDSTNIMDINTSTGAGTTSTLTSIVFYQDELKDQKITDENGWYIDFRGGTPTDAGEKLFDPKPFVLPDSSMIPHIYFNTFTPPSLDTGPKDNPCTAPQEGMMSIYDIALVNCGTSDFGLEGERFTGRIAGGGIYQGAEYMMYSSTSGNVADVPGGEGGEFVATPTKLPFAGGIVFWKEKKR